MLEFNERIGHLGQMIQEIVVEMKNQAERTEMMNRFVVNQEARIQNIEKRIESGTMNTQQHGGRERDATTRDGTSKS